MKKYNILIVIAAIILFAGVCTLMAANNNNQTISNFIAEIAGKASAAEKNKVNTVSGKSGWYYFVPELRSLSCGRFWGAESKKVSRVTQKEYADPLPAIMDFKKQLDKAKVELIVVPVPAKCTIYPDSISNLKLVSNGKVVRTDIYQQEFMNLLKSKGIKVIDLVPAFLSKRSGSLGNLYCKQDTHWSGQGCVAAANVIGAEINKYAWSKSVKKRKYSKSTKSVSVKGDMMGSIGKGAKPESLQLTFVKELNSSKAASGIEWRQSPVLLLGDSHNLIFHSGGDMQAQGAGLADNLAAVIGYPVDIVAVRGSGATPARLNLMRRNDNLAGKKLVVWCFSVREFTEGQGWRNVPIVK